MYFFVLKIQDMISLKSKRKLEFYFFCKQTNFILIICAIFVLKIKDNKAKILIF